MSRRPALLGALAALMLSAPADGHGRARAFPSLDSVGHSQRSYRAERRLRRVETALLGSAHAAEHARQRALALREADPAPATCAAPDNSLAPQVGGVWAPCRKLPIVAINAVLLRTGKVLYFSYPYRPHVTQADGTDSGPWVNAGDAYVYDPATGDSTQVEPPVDPATGKPAVIFCAGTSTLPDGRVLVAGGDAGDPTATKNQGLDTIYVFDPGKEQWQSQVRMRQSRWYPSQLELPDGRTAIMGGATRDNDPDGNLGIDTDLEVFSADGTLQRVQSLRLDRFDDNTNANGQPAGFNEAPFPGEYPHLFWMASGHGLVLGPRRTDTWRFFPSPAGTDRWTWTNVPDLPGGQHREWAAGALLPGSTEAMLFGGADVDDHKVVEDVDAGKGDAVASTVRFDDAATRFVDSASMRVARAFANSVLLPDGTVAIVGGGTGDHRPDQYYRWRATEQQKQLERYDPSTDEFTLANAQSEARTYHSTAILLPDGRVMSAGDDINGPGGPGTGARTDTAELWSPPYLFDADGTEAKRPVIGSAPASVGYGQSFVARTTDAVKRAVLVAPGAATHDTDMSQRVVPLPAPVRTTGGVTLKAPGSADLAPPGYYMLFLLDADGTPSKAVFVRVGPAPKPPPAATPTPTVTPVPPKPVRKLALRVKVTSTRLTRLRRTRRLRIRLTAARAASARVVVSRGRRRLAPARAVQLRAKRARVVRLRLSKPGRRALRHRRRARLVLRVTAVPAVGDPVTATRRVTLRR